MSEAGPVIGAAMPIVRTLPHLIVDAATALTRFGAFAEPQAVVATTTEIRAPRTATNPSFFNIRTLLVRRPYGYKTFTSARRFAPRRTTLARDSTPPLAEEEAVQPYRVAMCATASRPRRVTRRSRRSSR